jgi:hypothetical protein
MSRPQFVRQAKFVTITNVLIFAIISNALMATIVRGDVVIYVKEGATNIQAVSLMKFVIIICVE